LAAGKWKESKSRERQEKSQRVKNLFSSQSMLAAVMSDTASRTKLSIHRLRVLVVFEAPEMEDDVIAALSRAPAPQVFEFFPKVISSGNLEDNYPAGRAVFDFACLVLRQAKEGDYIKKIQRNVLDRSRIFSVDFTSPNWGGKLVATLFEQALILERTSKSLWEQARLFYKKVALRKGMAGTTLIVVSALITALGYIDKIQELGRRYVPHQVSERAESTLAALALFLSGVGALLVAIGLVVERSRSKKRLSETILRWLSATAVVGIAVFLQKKLSREAPSHRDTAIALIQDCSNQLWRSQTQGGIHVTAPVADHELPPVQAWITSQALVGLATVATNMAERKFDFERQIAWLDEVALDAWQLKPGTTTMEFLTNQEHGNLQLPKRSFDDLNEVASWFRSVGISNVPPVVMEELKANGKIRAGGGWGYFAKWRPGITEIEAWCSLAKTICLRRGVFQDSQEKSERLRQGIRRHLSSLRKREVVTMGQLEGVSPVPLPVEEEGIDKLPRTYSALTAIWAHIEALDCAGLLNPADENEARRFISRQIRVLVGQTSAKTLTVPNPTRDQQQEVFWGLTAQALHIIYVARSRKAVEMFEVDRERVTTLEKNYLHSLKVSNVSIGSLPVSENKRIHDADRYLLPINMAVEGSTFLWFPWSLLALSELKQPENDLLPEADRAEAARLFGMLVDRIPEMRTFALQEFNYVPAETLYCIGKALPMISGLDEKKNKGNE
jgi:hypothetical protein